MYENIYFPSSPSKVTLIQSQPMTDDEFYDFCQKNQPNRIERTKNREIIIMEPVGGESGYYENNVSYHLTSWNVKR